MNFKVRKISRKPKKGFIQKSLEYLKKNKKVCLALLVVLIIGGGVFSLQQMHPFHPVKHILNLSPLKADKNGHTNILVLGVGGFAQEGGNLSDSLMIVSISQKEKSLSLLSIPRDLFVASRVGERKLNEVYASAKFKYGDQKGLAIAKDAISNITKLDIHYAAVIDFKLFAELVDLIGGVEIFVPKAINDPFYPAPNYQYQTFTIRQGLQTLDGETALKYARSRKTSSDYARAQRQQDLLLAIKTKVEKQGLLSNLGKLSNLYKLVKERVNTDLSLTEIGIIAKHVQGLEYKNVVSSVLNDDPAHKGGILYTPAKDLYGGQFVLLPRDQVELEEFFKLAIRNPEIWKENAQISVLNGSKETGKANKLSKKLRQLGFHVIETGNFESDKALLKHRIRSLSQRTPKTTEFLTSFLHIQPTKTPSQLDSSTTPNENESGILDLEIILGTDPI
ncbi:hypothetical protein CSB37_01800 [bacterium DOLZORAL124_38_8]|nr:MAG: hypothetical protein CSB37_01800 [bacterium DOLZORAL124_38_8]